MSERTINILYVEEQSVKREQRLNALRNEGLYNITICTDAEHADGLMALPGSHFDLIILGHWLEDKPQTGVEYLERLRENYDPNPVILLSDREDYSGKADVGRTTFVGKDVPLKTLVEVVKQVRQNLTH